MPTTRSTTRKQAKLEDFAQDTQTAGVGSRQKKVKSTASDQKVSKQSVSANSSAKRTTSQTEDSKPASKPKRQKQQHFSTDSVEKLEQPIVINRAPVLQLWGAVVAHFLHQDLPWQACLSVGNAISSLCAVSKGRAIGMIEPKAGESDENSEEKAEASRDNQQVSVMGFPLRLKDNAVLMGGKPKRLDENTLRNKFGEEHYEVVKKAMLDNLETWSSNKDDLDKQAFHMYEKFRPNVAAGQQGWGRKGELKLHKIASVITRP